jgi:hypothetical protein
VKRIGLKKILGEIKYPSKEEFKRTVDRCVIMNNFRDGEIRFMEMLRQLAVIEEVDGVRVDMPIPISAKALLRGMEIEKEQKFKKQD